MTPPAARLRALAVRLLDARTVEYLVDPAIADLQAEYEEASRRGLANARQVRVEGRRFHRAGLNRRWRRD